MIASGATAGLREPRMTPAQKSNADRPRIRLIAFDDIQLGTQRRYLVKGLIPRTGLIIVWGPPKSGKSFWTFDMMMHVALDRDYRSRRVHHGAVVYCAFEGQTGFEARCAAFRQRLLAEDRKPVPFFLEPVTLDLVRDASELASVIRLTLGDTKPVAIVLDTLNRSLRGSESSDEDMADYVRAADTLREAFECAIIIVHHCGIDGTRPRGHTSLTGAADAQLSVRRDAADNIVVMVEYAKDGLQGGSVVSRLEVVEVGTDEDGEAITSCVVIPAEAVDANASKPPRMSKAATIALRALTEAIAECGEAAPASNHVPEAARVVALDRWRDYAYQRGVSTSDEPRARQLAFKRASEHLIAARIVGVWGNDAWLADKEANILANIQAFAHRVPTRSRRPEKDDGTRRT
jgi:hypothetical protein